MQFKLNQRQTSLESGGTGEQQYQPEEYDQRTDGLQHKSYNSNGSFKSKTDIMSQSFDPLKFTFEQINVTDPMDTGRISFDPSQSFNPKQNKPEDNPY